MSAPEKSYAVTLPWSWSNTTISKVDLSLIYDCPFVVHALNWGVEHDTTGG